MAIMPLPPAFSLFLPVYNEQDCLGPNTEKLLEHAGRLGVSFELLIGSNGSTDNTVRIGRELERRHSQVRFFHISRRGPGLALRRGLELMRHEAVICLDMDLSSDLSFVERSLELLRDHDIVIGSKKTGTEKRRLVRRLGSDLFIASSRLLLGLPFNDFSLGAKAYRREILMRYMDHIDRWTAYVQYVVYLAYRDGCRITEIPVQCNDFRRSRFDLRKEGFHRFSQLVRLWFSSIFHQFQENRK